MLVRMKQVVCQSLDQLALMLTLLDGGGEAIRSEFNRESS